MKLNLEKRTLLIIGLFALLTIAVISGVIIPTVRSIQKAVDDTQELRNYLEQRYERIANLRTSIKKINQIRAQVAAYPDHLFTRGQELDLITTLERLAAKNNVTQKINSSNLGKLTDNRITLSINITGSYPQTMRYLADIEALPYFLNVTKLQLTSAATRFNQAGPNNQPASLNLDLSLYVN